MERLSEQIKNIIKTKERYKNFVMLDEPVHFNELFSNNDIDVVQVHSTYPAGDTDIIGFCGQFSWKNNELRALDHDTYNPGMTVYGYEKWNNPNINIQLGIDVLVGEDW